MLYILIFTAVFVIAAAVIDCVCTIKRLKACALADYNRNILLIPVTGHMDDIGSILQNAADITESSGYSCRCVICDFGADKETMIYCRKFSEDNEKFVICSGEYAENLLQFL